MALSPIVMCKPMNAHGHPRYQALMDMIAPLIGERYYACVAMPNPKKFHILNVERMLTYHAALTAREPNVRWIMKLYFSEGLTPQEVERAALHPDFGGLKYYPRGLTTNSEDGIRDPSLLWTKGSLPYEVMRVMADLQKPVSYHGADGFDALGVELDPYDQEEHFYHETCPRIFDAHPDAIHIGEHISTVWGVDFWKKHGGHKRGCTITGHHPYLDRRDVYRGGHHSHFYCLPVIQPAIHQAAVQEFMTDGYPFVMLGDDGAGHPREAKECGCCAGGVFTCPVSLELYAEQFVARGKLHNFEAFASLNGPRFYGIDPSTETIKLVNEPWQPPEEYSCEDGTEVVCYHHPDRDGKGRPDIQWKLAA